MKFATSLLLATAASAVRLSINDKQYDGDEMTLYYVMAVTGGSTPGQKLWSSDGIDGTLDGESPIKFAGDAALTRELSAAVA